MATLKCKMCGGDLIPDAGGKIFTCAYCGTAQTAPNGEDEGKLNLFNRANKQRLNSEFDKAAALYERLVTEYPDDAEGYWGLCLSKYGIEYVDDPVTGKKVPTCHRASYDAITADPDYKAALDHADPAARAVYMEQGYAIDTLQRGILDIVKNEKPFDVFLCYKETDAAGKRTPDSVIANDIYYQLTNEGFKVFYAAITLESKLGQEYEPYIFAALHSARVMLVIGTDPDYFNAVWVKNEWSRYLKLMKTDRTKLLIPCYRDMDAYDLPEEFSHLQAQDMSKIGFITDVIRGIKKVLQRDAPKAAPAAGQPVIAAQPTGIAVFLKRGALSLEDGDWKSADGFFEQALNVDPESGEAYLGKLMASLGVKNRNALRDLAQPFDQDPNFQKALRFGDEKLQNDLTGAIAFINERNENARLEGIYQQGLAALQSANSEQDFPNAAAIFQSIPGYKNADGMVEACEEGRREWIYQKGLSVLQSAKKETDFDTSAEYFYKIPGYRDAEQMIAACEEGRKEWIYQKALQNAGQASDRPLEEAIRLLQTIPGYRDADYQLSLAKEKRRQLEEKSARAAEERKRKTKIILAVAAAVVVLAIGFSILNKNVLVPNRNYKNAVALKDAGKYDEAIAAFEAMDGYKDSADQIQKIFADWLKNAKVGDYVPFGAYEQDNQSSNGKETIEWLVLEKNDDKMLLISRYALDCKPYNNMTYTDVTWETCWLRKWLNNDFLNAAFSETEQGQIVSSTVTADKNPSYSTSLGNDTTDKVFLLSIPEANTYFKTKNKRICGATDYAAAQGAYTNGSYSAGGKAAGWWWLRSPGYDSNYAAGVNYDGSVSNHGIHVNYGDGAVRPALWIDLES